MVTLINIFLCHHVQKTKGISLKKKCLFEYLGVKIAISVFIEIVRKFLCILNYLLDQFLALVFIVKYIVFILLKFLFNVLRAKQQRININQLIRVIKLILLLFINFTSFIIHFLCIFVI